MSLRFVYGLFLLFCALVAARDVLSEHFFKRAAVDPAFALFVYSVLTQAIALAWLGPRRLFRRGIAAPGTPGFRSFLLLNASTGLSFMTYFLAVATPLGAGLSSVLGFGSDPIITAGLGAWLLGERLDRKFWVATGLCLVSLTLLYWGNVQVGAVTVGWVAGLVLCLVSTFFFALSVIAMKQLLNLGAPKPSLIFHRLTFTTLGTGAYLAVRPDAWNGSALPSLAGVGIVAYALPLIVFPYVIERITIVSLAVLLFLIPAFTLAFSWLSGLGSYGPADLVAATLLFLAVWAYHWRPSPAHA